MTPANPISVVSSRTTRGIRDRNDTEHLEKLFELYTKMTAKGKAA
jgi:hypothetical protein